MKDSVERAIRRHSVCPEKIEGSDESVKVRRAVKAQMPIPVGHKSADTSKGADGSKPRRVDNVAGAKEAEDTNEILVGASLPGMQRENQAEGHRQNARCNATAK